jgi:hypothetical protein
LPPVTEGKRAFHVVMDYANGWFSMDPPDGPNGVLVHYEVMKASRSMKNRFWEFDIKAESQEHALAEMQKAFPGCNFRGAWAETRAR